MPLTVEIVTAERVVRIERGVDVLVAPGSEGQLAILPRHAPLMTTLEPGLLEFKRGGVEEDFAITGGFMEVRNDHVIVLADAAESVEEIDLARAEAARARAEDRLREYREGGHPQDEDLLRVQLALQRAVTRLKLGQRRGRRSGVPSSGER
ncbi:MAG: F0F1 ATP synthase subunit epsilon [Dehalococcoidia bacterium]